MKKAFFTLAVFTILLSGCYSQAQLEGEYKTGYNDGYYEGYSKAQGEYENQPDYYDGYDAGYDDGYSDGYLGDYSDGYLDGYDVVVEFYEKYEGPGYFDVSLIPMLSVDSSFIDSVGYSPTYKELVIAMNGKNLYAYHQVDAQTFLGLLTADSPGSYFNTYIKDKYEYTKYY